MRTPTRTDLVEAHEGKIQRTRWKATDYTTTARHYTSLAESIDAIRAEGGPFFTDARADVANFARERAAKCAETAARLLAEADLLEEQGLA